MPSSSRNAPCPCGSGKKYKRCCLPRKLGHRPAERSALKRAFLWLYWFWEYDRELGPGAGGSGNFGSDGGELDGLDDGD